MNFTGRNHGDLAGRRAIPIKVHFEGLDRSFFSSTNESAHPSKSGVVLFAVAKGIHRKLQTMLLAVIQLRQPIAVGLSHSAMRDLPDAYGQIIQAKRTRGLKSRSNFFDFFSADLQINNYDYNTMDYLTPDPQAAIHRSSKRPACNYCKKRKIKCDGLANCFQCQKRGLKCEYSTNNTTNECNVVARLTKRVCRLASELEQQKKLADYWRAQFEELKCEKCNKSESVCAARPEFCIETKELCSNVSDAVSSVLNAFIDITRALLPASTTEYNLTYATMLWNRLVDSRPDEVVARIRSLNLDTIIEMLYYSSIFALGSRLHQDDDLSVHFHQIADGLLSTTNIAENYCKVNPDAARQVALAHIYCLFYYKASGMYTSIGWQWQQTADFIGKIGSNLAEDTSDEISAWIMLFAPTSQTDLIQMEATNGTIESILLKNITLGFRLLSQLHLGTESIAQQAWNLVIEAESHLVNVQASSNYTFYCVLIYALKALVAVNMPHEMNEEITRCTQIVAHLYTQLPTSSEQVWLSRDIEYLHHILTELQQEMPDIYGYDLMLDVVENIQFMFLTSPTAEMSTDGSDLSSSDADSMESLPYNYSSNQFMHPLVIYSPFATSC